MRNSEALAYLSTSGLNYEIVYFDKAVDQKNALYNGEVNLISSVSLSPAANNRTVAQFAPCPYYFAATKGNTDLIKKLMPPSKRSTRPTRNFRTTFTTNPF